MIYRILMITAILTILFLQSVSTQGDEAQDLGAKEEVLDHDVPAPSPKIPEKPFSTGQDETAELHYKKAGDFSKEGDKEAAIAEMTKAISLDPRNGKYYHWRGFYQESLASKYAFEDKDKENLFNLRALDDFNKCLTLTARTGPARFDHFSCAVSKVNILCNTGKVQEGVSFLAQQIEKARKASDALLIDYHSERGSCYMESKHIDKAIADFTTAITLRDKFAFKAWRGYELVYDESHGQKGVRNPHTGKFVSVEKIIDMNKRQAWSDFDNRGELYYRKGLLNKALADYEQACDIYREPGVTDERSARIDALIGSSPCKKALNVRREIRRGTKWVKITSTKEETWYYDKTSVMTKSTNYRKAWIRVEKEPSLNADGSFSADDDFPYELLLYHIDCSSRELGMESVIEYSSTGEMLNSEKFSPNDTRASVVPGSIGEDMLNAVCKFRSDNKNKPKKKRASNKDA
jgi:tetratricopeptide (TPR) repeat protein